jgi:hypothetical protein
MKAKPAVSIELDKKRHLLLDLNAMVAFQETTGKNLFSTEIGNNLSPVDLRALLWSCLIHEDEALTLKQVGSWIHTGNMTEIAEKLVAAWSESMPESEGESADPLVK